MNQSIFMKTCKGKAERKMLRVLESMQMREQKRRQEEENRKKEEASIQKSKLEIDLEEEMEKDSQRELNRRIQDEAKIFQEQKRKENLKTLRIREEEGCSTPSRRLSTIMDPKLGRRNEEMIRDQAENEIE